MTSTDDSNQDELTLQQQDRIAAEIASGWDLISVQEDISSLRQDFLSDPVFSAKILEIEKVYSKLRRTRPDGNCFFRGFGYRLFEILREEEAKLEDFKKAVEGSKDEMFELGFPQFTVEDFYENFMETVDRLGGETKMSLRDLEDIFVNESSSNYLVVFLRLLVSKQLQKDADFYRNFIEGGGTVKDFCATEVEPMYRESDHIHIIGITAATGVGVRVIYLDREQGDQGRVHDFPEGCEPTVHLLYRPGHYDILYPR